MRYLSVPQVTTISKLNEEVLKGLVAECEENLTLLKELNDLLNDEADPYDQLDALEAVYLNMSVDNIVEYDLGFVAPSHSIAKRAAGASHYLKQLADISRKASTAYSPLTTEEVKDLKVSVEKALGETSYFLFYGFLLDQTERSIQSGEEIAVATPVASFLDDKGMSVQDFVSFVREIMKDHRPDISILEAFPNLEDEFFNLVGAYVRDFETYSEFVTYEMVKDLLDGKRDPESVVKELEQLFSESEED